MAVTKKIAKSKKQLKKEKVNEISALLKPALSKLKKEIAEKDFEKKIKKAAKFLADGIKPLKIKKPSIARKVVKIKSS